MTNLIGFLAPDGTFTECSTFEHMLTAEHIANTKHNQNFYSGLAAEEYLFDIGYVGFYACSALKSFVIGEKIVLLSKEQLIFIFTNLNRTNNSEQETSIRDMIELDDAYRENSCLDHVSNKFTRN